MDSYAYQVYDQFSNHVEYTVIDDCIDNYIFLVDRKQCVSNIVSPLSYDHFYEEKVVVTDDQDLIIRELEGYQFSSGRKFMDEQFVHIDQYAFKDSFAALLESYFSSHDDVASFNFYIREMKIVGRLTICNRLPYERE